MIPSFKSAKRARARARARARNHSQFPRFLDLPRELRQQIWEYFCPVLTQHDRKWELDLHISDAFSPRPPGWTLYLMNKKPNEIFAMSAVHRESRQIINDAFPDTLLLHPPTGLLRFNQKMDIIAFTTTQFGGISQSALLNFLSSGFATSIHHLSLDTYILEAFFLNRDFAFASAFSTVRVLYLTIEDEFCLQEEIYWCGEKETKKVGIEELTQLFCFPTIPNHSDEREMIPDLQISDMEVFLRAVALSKVFSTETQAVVLPMVLYQGSESLTRLVASRKAYLQDMLQQEEDKRVGEGQEDDEEETIEIEYYREDGINHISRQTVLDYLLRG